MNVWILAKKNFLDIFKNYLILALLILMPIMQLYMIYSITNSFSELSVEENVQWVELIILSTVNMDNMLQIYAAGIMVQFLLMTGMIAGSTIIKEREQHTMIRIYTAPISKLNMLLGISLGNAAVIFLISVILILFTFVVFDVYWGAWMGVLIVTFVAVFVATAMSLLISGLFKSSKVAGGVMSLVVIGMTFLSGDLIQSEKLELISLFTINRWISNSYYQLMMGNSLLDISINLCVLILIGAVLLFASILVYRKEDMYE